MKPAVLAPALAALCATACGDEVVRYQGPDATVWAGRRAPIALPDGGIGVVTNNGESTVTLLGLAEQRVLSTEPVGVIPLTVNGPHHLAIDPALGALYTPLAFPAPPIAAGPHAAHGSSTRPGVLVKRSLTDFHLLGRADTEPNPGDIALSPDGSLAFVTHFDLVKMLNNRGNRPAQLSDLVVIDTASMTRVASLPLCIAAHGLVLSPDARTLYVACYGDDALAVVDVSGIRQGRAPTSELVLLGAQTADGSPSRGPYGLVRSADGATVWVACFEGAALIAFDTAARRFDQTRALRLPGRPSFPVIMPDGTMLAPLQSADVIARVQLEPRMRVSDVHAYTPAQCVLPHQVSVGPDGRVYVVCEGVHTATRQEPGTVMVIDANTLDVVSVWPVGIFPDGVLFFGAR